MDPLFEGLTSSEIKYLQYLQNNPYFDGFEMFLTNDTSTDYRIKKFIDNGYITMERDGPHSGSRYIAITGKGNAALVDYHRFRKSSFKSKALHFFLGLFRSSL